MVGNILIYKPIKNQTYKTYYFYNYIYFGILFGGILDYMETHKKLNI
jgi:hypothetical protein